MTKIYLERVCHYEWVVCTRLMGDKGSVKRSVWAGEESLSNTYTFIMRQRYQTNTQYTRTFIAS